MMKECATMAIRVAVITALISIVIPLAAAVAQTLAPSPVFEANTTTPAKNGATQSVHISVQLWELGGPNGATHEISLRGFYVAHLLSGDVSTTIDGRTTEQQ